MMLKMEEVVSDCHLNNSDCKFYESGYCRKGASCSLLAPMIHNSTAIVSS